MAEEIDRLRDKIAALETELGIAPPPSNKRVCAAEFWVGIGCWCALSNVEMPEITALFDESPHWPNALRFTFANDSEAVFFKYS